MSFLTPSYFLFFPLAAAGSFLLPRKARDGWLLGCSWFFYLCAGAEYLPFLLGSCIAVYFAARRLEVHRSKVLLGCMAALFIGLLFVFKYLAFAFDALKAALALLGLDWSAQVPSLLLPAGISFYFFSALGYLIDVYRGDLPAEKSFVRTGLFLSFFPSLLSGPIGRAKSFLPQLDQERSFRWQSFREGLTRFLFGAFLKLVPSDRLAVVASAVFAAPEEFGSVQVIAAMAAFAVQIYCDFAAYSHMALGSAKVMGFDLVENFNTPYFSRSIAEFWRRWHMSLSTWFRDYLYIPLGGSRAGKAKKYRNLLIVFAVSGLWHGSAVTFLIWGLLNGVYQIIGAVTAKPRAALRQKLRLREGSAAVAAWQMLWVFLLSMAAWVFFKSADLANALAMFRAALSPVLWKAPLSAMGTSRAEFVLCCGALGILLGWDTIHYRRGRPEKLLAEGSVWINYLLCLALLVLTVVFGRYGAGFDPQSFIYGAF